MEYKNDFIHKEGYGNLFINEKKQGEQPDLRGQFTSPCDIKKGDVVEIAAWSGKTQKGKKMLSLKVQEPYNGKNENKPEKQPKDYPEKKDNVFRDMDDSIPF